MIKWLENLFNKERELQAKSELPDWYKEIEDWKVERTEISFDEGRNYLIISPTGESLEVPGMVLELAVAEVNRANHMYWLENASPIELLHGRWR